MTLTWQAFADTWHLGVEMPTARTAAAGIVGSDGKIYVIGGWVATSNGYSAAVERFDEATQRWESVAALTVPTGWSTVVKDKAGGIWLFGGDTPYGITNSIYRYDLTGDRWIAAGTMPNRRSFAQGVVDSKGLIYLMGGLTVMEEGTALVQRFDPNESTWTTLPPLNTGRCYHGVFIDGNDRIFAVGGVKNLQLLSSVECLDLRNLGAGWVSKSPIPAARQLQGIQGADGSFYAVGGWDGGFVGRVDRYDPATDTWFAYPPLNFGNNNMTLVMGISGRLYSIGGESSPMVETTRVEYTDIQFTRAEVIGSIVINGIVGQTYRIDYATTLGGAASWAALTNFMLPSSPFRVVDWGSAGLPSRFYRTVLVP
ncbi:MAG TPA: kelch repeat-containing protein [Verrucomicrobiae bacterium]